MPSFAVFVITSADTGPGIGYHYVKARGIGAAMNEAEKRWPDQSVKDAFSARELRRIAGELEKGRDDLREEEG